MNLLRLLSMAYHTFVSQTIFSLRMGLLLLFSFPFLIHAQTQKPSNDQGSNQPVPISKYGPGQIGPNEILKLDREIATLNLDSVLLQIVYPEKARENKLEGNVYLNILVDEKGHYRDHIRVYANDEIFPEAIEAQLKFLRFEPAIFEGKPIAYWVTIPFAFDWRGPQHPNSRNYKDRSLICRTIESATEYEGKCNVTQLWITGAEFSKIPEEVYQLKHLRYLVLTYGNITEVSTKIQQLQHLEVLNLMGNDLTDLPSELWTLPKLYRVWLSSNNFSEKTQKRFEKAHSRILLPKNEAGEVEW